MLVKLELEPNKVKAFNERIEECKKEGGDSEIWNNWLVKENGKTGVLSPLNDYPIGFYHIGHRAIEDLTNYKITDEYSSFSPKNLEEYVEYKNSRNNYGVCDNYKQILRKYPEVRKDKNRKFVIDLKLIRREKQLEEGGWRWHKWGEYIGKQKPQCEYIFNEPKIREVILFHIYEVERRNII